MTKGLLENELRFELGFMRHYFVDVGLVVLFARYQARLAVVKLANAIHFFMPKSLAVVVLQI